MKKLFGEGSGKYFTGYYSGLYSKLGLIEKSRKGKKVTYKLNVPMSWGTTAVNEDVVQSEDE